MLIKLVTLVDKKPDLSSVDGTSKLYACRQEASIFSSYICLEMCLQQVSIMKLFSVRHKPKIFGNGASYGLKVFG